jgi:hypothetical protein
MARPGGLVGVDRDLLLARIRRVRQFGWPRSFPLVQFPNGPLIAAFAGGVVASMIHGVGHRDALAVSYLAMMIWAYEELVDGVNWFRHLLGLVYVVSTATHLAMAIRH